MAQHRAAVYSVTVHTKRKTKDLKPLGSIDGQGTYLGDVFDEYLDEFTGHTGDGSKHLRCETPEVDGDYLFLLSRHGKTGDRADIEKDGETEFRQTPEHEHVLLCSSLFYLPRGETHGWWAVHINGGRSAKALIQPRLLAKFREQFGGSPDDDKDKGLTLKITPVVSGTALDEAIEKDLLERLTLRTLKRPSDVASLSRWVPSHREPTVSVEIGVRKGAHLLGDPIKRFLKGETKAMDEIVEFDGLKFQEASVTVTLPSGKSLDD